jgi:hypothetical protein
MDAGDELVGDLTTLEAGSQCRVGALSSAPHQLRLCDERHIFSACRAGWHSGDAALEAIMRKEIFQENKARWEVFEWMGSTQTKIIWAVAAAIVVLGVVYLLS